MSFFNKPKQSSEERLLDWFIETEKNRQNHHNNVITSLPSTNEDQLNKNKTKKEILKTIRNNLDDNYNDNMIYSRGTKTTMHMDDHNRSFIKTYPKNIFEPIKIMVKPVLPHPLIFFINNFSKQVKTKSLESNDDEFEEEKMNKLIEFLKVNEYVKHRETYLLLSNITIKKSVSDQIVNLIYYSDNRTILFALKIYQIFIIKIYRSLKNYYTNEIDPTSVHKRLNIIRAYEFFLNSFNNEHKKTISLSSSVISNLSSSNTSRLSISSSSSSSTPSSSSFSSSLLTTPVTHSSESLLTTHSSISSSSLPLPSPSPSFLSLSTSTSSFSSSSSSSSTQMKTPPTNDISSVNKHNNIINVCINDGFDNGHMMDICDNDDNDDSVMNLETKTTSEQEFWDNYNYEEFQNSYLRTPKLKINERYISFVRKTVILQWIIICLSPWGLKNAKVLQNYFPYHVLGIINLMKGGGKSQIINGNKKIQIIPSSLYTFKYWMPLNDLAHFGFHKKLVTDAITHFNESYNSILIKGLPIPISLIEDTVKISL